MLACLPMVCQSTRPTGESGRTARDTDAKSWLRRGLRRAKRCLGGGVLGGWVVVYVCVYVYPWGVSLAAGCALRLGGASALHVGLAWRLTRRSRAVQSPAAWLLAARCSLPVMSAG